MYSLEGVDDEVCSFPTLYLIVYIMVMMRVGRLYDVFVSSLLVSNSSNRCIVYTIRAMYCVVFYELMVSLMLSTEFTTCL